MYPFYYGLDPTMIILIPAIILAMYAQIKVNSTTAKYFRVRNSRSYSGADVARMILDRNGLQNVPVNPTGGKLTDHYDPRNRSVTLSQDVYYGNSITSMAVAAHECGHAIQHQHNYFPLNFRKAIVPVVNFASNISWLFIFGGLFMGGSLLKIGIILFSATVLFQIVTLPVEFNASRRALRQLDELGITTGQDELRMSRKVLQAAALTYVAGALSAISQLLRLVLISQSRD